MYAVLGALILSSSFSFKVFPFIVVACFYIYSYLGVINSSFCKEGVLKSISAHRIVIFFFCDYLVLTLI